MPKQRITKEMVMEVAFEILRNEGESQVLVKTIATRLGCSVQPIYSYCENMDALKQELSTMAGRSLREYVAKKIDPQNLFESTGKAYSTFAREEPHLFQSYFLRKREEISSFEDLYRTEGNPDMVQYLAKTHQISEQAAKELHMNLMIYNTGISFILLSTGGTLTKQEIDQKLAGACQAFLALAQKNWRQREIL